MKNKNLIPFGLYPAHWGLKGKMREVARAEHELMGEELEFRMLKINIGDRSDDEIEIDNIKLKAKYGHIDSTESAKQIATVKDEPWVVIKTLETDPDNPRYGGVELDWNAAFVRNLEKHNYGPNPEEDDTVNEWFNDLCRNIALDAYDGMGDLQERIENEQNTRTGMHEDAIFTPRPKAEDDDAAQ